MQNQSVGISNGHSLIDFFTVVNWFAPVTEIVDNICPTQGFTFQIALLQEYIFWLIAIHNLSLT